MGLDPEELLETAMKQIYSETMLDHGRNPRNLGDLEETNAFGIICGPCGDTMAMWLKVEDNKIADIGFTTDGCMTSLAAGSMTTEMAKGKTLIDAQQISQQDILDALEGLPKESEHCALLAVNTLRDAITNYQTETGDK
ncbi:MAG TPA: iron-sulfur cluster assembly scaffold protein [Dehalococcoidales bacterium]|nr:iron-sulfur cluster assembly scaffold protein [Dehalococcoidales bacterium]